LFQSNNVQTLQLTSTPKAFTSKSNNNKNFQCGIRKTSDLVASGLVINGLKSPRAGFPWLAAHYHTTKHFICGGSLVSHKIVMTAAHCIWNKGDLAPITEYESTYYLGKHKLKDLDENDYVSSDVQKFKIHPNWNTKDKKYDSDIAIAILTKNIQYTNTVRPICIYSGTPGHNDIVNKEGYIAGE
jgi:secreted trypsin-like serine protease